MDSRRISIEEEWVIQVFTTLQSSTLERLSALAQFSSIGSISYQCSSHGVAHGNINGTFLKNQCRQMAKWD
jgi:hypothetical protein